MAAPFRSLLVAFALAASTVGCTEREELRAHQVWPSADPNDGLPLWLVPPAGHGGGPPQCHDDGPLGVPAEPPEGFDKGSGDELDPAHPPHLDDEEERLAKPRRAKGEKGHEDNI